MLSRYGNLGASSRVRLYQYLPYFQKAGIEATIVPLLDNEYLADVYAGKPKRPGAIGKAYVRRLRHLMTSRRFDLLWIEYEVFPWLPAWVESLLALLRIPYVVDYDDAVFHNYDLHANRLVRALLGKKIDAVMRGARLVLVGNDYLAQRAQAAGAKRIEYVPTVVDVEQYKIAPPQIDDGFFNIGWIGSPITFRYLHQVKNALAEVCGDGRTRLVTVGAGDVKLEGVPVASCAWSKETEVKDIQSFDVGIMPLPDEPFEYGKCGYKLIQYMACGRPAVASPVGVNQRIVEGGVNGFLAASASDWVGSLKTLRDSRSLRERMGSAGRNKIESEYSVQVIAPRLVSLLLIVSAGN